MKKVVFLAVLVFVAVASFSACGIMPKNYEQAKKQTLTFFNQNQDEIEAVKNKAIEKKSTTDLFLEGVSSISGEICGEETFVFFDYDAQGMLGGQYWGFYHSSGDVPKVQADYAGWCCLTEEKEGCYYWKEKGGNDFYATERIKENWFFFYTDYDGGMHGLDWGK